MSDQPLNLNNDASKMPNQQQEYYIDEEGILHFGSSKPSPAPGSSKPTPPSGSSKPTPPPVNNGKTVPPVKSAPTPPPMTEPSDDCDVPEKKSKKGCVIAGVGCGIAVLIAAIVIAVVAIIIYNNNQPHYNSSDTDTMKVVIPEPEEELAVDSAVVLSINSVRDLPVENYDANYLSNNYNVYVYDAEFMNVDYDNDVLTSAGSILYSDEMRYLKPIIKFNNYRDEGITKDLFYKIINPQGELIHNSNNSTVYTATCKLNVTDYESTLNASGWGNNSESIYQPGEYRFELYCDGVCVFYKYFYIQ